MRESFYGTSLSLPAKVAVDLSYCAKGLGVSQSALVTQLLGPPLADMRTLLERPELSGRDAASALRLRGASAAIVAQRVREAMEVIAGGRGDK
jgi:hypothetical protein